MNRPSNARVLVAGLALAALSACEAAKSSNPLSPSVAGPIAGVSITAPKPLEPSTGSELVAQGGLVTLLIENAATSGQRSLWLSVELAADANFQQVLHQADRVSLGANGRTAYKIPEPLAPGYTYFWRARAQDGANTGPFSAVFSFKMVAAVLIEPPTPLEPVGNINTNRPEFKVQNGKFSGTPTVMWSRLSRKPSPGVPASAPRRPSRSRSRNSSSRMFHRLIWCVL